MYEAHLLSAEVPQVQWSIAEWRLGPSFWDAPPEFVRKEWIAHIFITEHSQNSEKFRHDWTLWQDNYGSVSASRLRWSHKCRLFFPSLYSNSVIWKATLAGKLQKLRQGKNPLPLWVSSGDLLCLPIPINVFLIWFSPPTRPTCLVLQCGYCLPTRVVPASPL